MRGAYVDILENLHNGRLQTYRGRSRLSTWLLLVARNAATDALRHEHGRRELPRGLRRLSELHQEVYRLYYVQGEPFTATLKQLWLLGHELDEDGLVDLLAEIDAQVTDRSSRRLRYDLAAESVGAASGRLLEFCDAARLDAEETGRRLDPLATLIARESELRALKALRLVAELPPEERRIMSLRFEEGLTADQIAERLGIPNRRRVFTLLESIIRRLRRRHAELEKTTPGAGNSGSSAVPQPENTREDARDAARPPRAAGD